MTIIKSDMEVLKDAVATRSGQGLLDFAAEQEGGASGLLDKVFAAIPATFNTARSRSATASMQYEIRTPEGVQHFYIDIKEGICTTGRGIADSPRATISVGLAEFLRIVTGKLNGMQAYLTGKIKIKGDMFFVTKFEHWIDRP